MADALIGYTGFVGTTLMKQSSYESLYRSTNIEDINNRSFDTLVCAGAPAQKWRANQHPEADSQTIHQLINHLKTIRCKHFILISTVDVFKSPIDVDEKTPIDTTHLNAYGLHRYKLENFVQNQFSKHLIVRLPGLVGPGLRKNIIFDLLNQNNIKAIDTRNVFQFYPMVNLWYDIQIATQNNLNLLHLTAEPIRVQDVAERGFGLSFTQTLTQTQVHYNMQSCYAHLFNSTGRYQYNQRETIQAIRAYAQSEPLQIKD